MKEFSTFTWLTVAVLLRSTCTQEGTCPSYAQPVWLNIRWRWMSNGLQDVRIKLDPFLVCPPTSQCTANVVADVRQNRLTWRKGIFLSISFLSLIDFQKQINSSPRDLHNVCVVDQRHRVGCRHVVGEGGARKSWNRCELHCIKGAKTLFGVSERKFRNATFTGGVNNISIPLLVGLAGDHNNDIYILWCSVCL